MGYAPERGKAYREENRERIAAYHKEWRKRNKEHQFEKQRQWREENKEHVREMIQRWTDANPHKWRMYDAARRAAKRNATPRWADPEQMKVFYAEALVLSDLLDEEYQVDHIVPLQSDLVCGLHNQFNLQVLPASENRSKSNRFWPDMP